MNPRAQRGLEIASKSGLIQEGGAWIVPSQTGTGIYRVDARPDSQRCTCPDFELRREKCKHIFAVEFTVQAEQKTDGGTTTTILTKTVKVTYKQEWTAYNTAQTKEKDLFERLLHDLCIGVPEPQQTKGRPRLSCGDMIFCAGLKVYSTMSSRRLMSDLREAHAKGYIGKVPHFNSVLNYLETEALTPVLKQLIARSGLPMKALETDFACDSSGFSTCQYVRWFDAKYGKERDRHDWIKIHLMAGVRTHIVTSVEITGRDAHDAPLLPMLTTDTASRFTIKQVSADKGYSSADNHVAVASVGATPYIAFKSTTTGGIGGLFQKMFHYYSLNRDAFLAEYHKRSNAESTFSMIKAKFGGHLRSKSGVAQINEALIKILCHNICVLIQSIFEFGVEPTFCAESAPAQKPS